MKRDVVSITEKIHGRWKREREIYLRFTNISRYRVVYLCTTFVKSNTNVTNWSWNRHGRTSGAEGMESVKIRECRIAGWRRRIPMKRDSKRISGIYRTFHKLYFQIDLFRVSNEDWSARQLLVFFSSWKLRWKRNGESLSWSPSYRALNLIINFDAMLKCRYLPNRCNYYCYSRGNLLIYLCQSQLQSQ